MVNISDITKCSVDDFKLLPEDKKPFVLGVMQGILISQPDKKNEEDSKETSPISV